ncbi:hypothetical protein ACWGJ9_10305 [Curtobacterium citreum]
MPKTRAGQRLTLLATWVVLTAIAVPAGWNAGRVADSQYVFIMTSIALPVGLAGLLSVWHIGLAVIGGARRVRRLDVAGWPAGRRRIAAAGVGIAGAVGVTNLIQWVHDDTPAGLIIAVVLGAAAATFDTIQLVRKRRR